MTSKKTAPTESLHLARWYEEIRAAYLHNHNRRTEALDAELEASKYKQRIKDELGVEFN